MALFVCLSPDAAGRKLIPWAKTAWSRRATPTPETETSCETRRKASVSKGKANREEQKKRKKKKVVKIAGAHYFRRLVVLARGQHVLITDEEC
ncbi:hypothetical protein CCHR01_06852 [Colletotrichum chrysophilum]|uniref:Uncharacterized protein n=1 Tax=Colletotrichum chrysophilum TaxID=1836956 RepID=A0AAD9EGF2_9PEZI|nr:hypothetical protein CCHR01_06852 [Colletotrichum chrysophilum]